jgi:hypothetical protein
MKTTGNIDRQNKLITFFAGVLALVFVLAGCSSSSSSSPTTTPATVTVSGTVTNLALVPEPGVAVEGVYTTPGDAGNTTATTDASGNYTLTVETNRAVYIRFTKAGFLTLNSEKGTLTTNETGNDIEYPTTTETQALIDVAWNGTNPQLGNHAWLAVDVTDALDNEVNNETITSVPAVTDEVYTECDGTDSGGNVTTGAPCFADRQAPMYIGYFDATADARVSAAPTSNDTRIAPVRMGEFTFVDFAQ